MQHLLNQYPGSGTTWYGLTENQNQATLNNGPTLEDSNYISFDGTNDYASFTTEWSLLATGKEQCFKL